MLELAFFWGAVVLSYTLFKLFVSHFKKKHAFSECSWQGRIDYILTRPIELLLTTIFLTYSALWILKKWEIDPQISHSILLIKDLLVIFCVSWGILRWKKIFHGALLNRKPKRSLDPTSLDCLSKLFTLFVGLIGTLSILHVLGMNILPLVTFGGIGAATLGFASKDVFANFFSGLMLHFTRPFSLHDQVELPGKKIKGHIEEIGWYLTIIRDPQKGPVYLPNSLFSHEVLINNSRTRLRRLEETICFCSESLDYLNEAVETIRTALQAHPEIDSEKSIYVFLKTLDPPFVEIEIKAYTISSQEEEFLRIKQEVLLIANQILQEAAASVRGSAP